MSSKTSPLPSLDFELSFQAQGVRYIIGLDEVGRGCIAGDVAVGAVLVDLDKVPAWPTNLKDSKLLTEKARVAMLPELQSWAQSHSVGLASVTEIEQHGIITALSLAADRALQQLNTSGIPADQIMVILDGNQDYLGIDNFQVVTKVKADQICVSVAAASVIAKVTRDNLMQELAKEYPGYGLDSNKGYASAQHRQALLTLGTTPIHRISWLSKILEG
jgi:ribonuclease HII